MRTALLAGTIAGLVLFLYQYVFVVPRILEAERFEEHTAEHDWKPDNGWERNFFTAASTVLVGIGYSALLVAAVALGGFGFDVRKGLLWGLAGFVCFTVAPALGLPPEPPGVPAADVRARQLWWVFTAAATAIGVMLLLGRGQRWMVRLGGVVLIGLPHVIGAPYASGTQAVPAALVRGFAVASVVGSAIFWLVLGAVAGALLPSKHGSDTEAKLHNCSD